MIEGLSNVEQLACGRWVKERELERKRERNSNPFYSQKEREREREREDIHSNPSHSEKDIYIYGERRREIIHSNPSHCSPDLSLTYHSPHFSFPPLLSRHTLTLNKSGHVYGWGYNSYGELGVDDLSVRTVPTLIKALEGLCITSIAAGERHSAMIGTCRMAHR